MWDTERRPFFHLYDLQKNHSWEAVWDWWYLLENLLIKITLLWKNIKLSVLMFESSLQFKHSSKNTYLYFVDVKKWGTNNASISWLHDVTHHITLQTLTVLLSQFREWYPLLFEAEFCRCKWSLLMPLSPAMFANPSSAVSTSFALLCSSPHALLMSSSICSWWCKQEIANSFNFLVLIFL